jgi:outer membrane immunogenic protein
MELRENPRVNMKTVGLTSCLTLFLATGVAFAADLPSRKGPPAPAPAPAYSWTGFHAGLTIGGGWGQTQWTDTLGDTALLQGDFDGNNAGQTATTDQSGGVLGGQIGYDYQFAGKWVVGVGAKFSGTTISGTNVDQFNVNWSLHNNIDWFGTVTGRLGYAVVDTLLIYGRGGFAYGDNKVTVTNAGFRIGEGSLQTRTGWTAGGGVEWAFAPNWSAFLEGDYHEFSAQQDHFPGNAVGVQNPFGAQTKQSFETLTVGVNFRTNFLSNSSAVKF